MPMPPNIGTREIPLRFAKILTQQANDAFQNYQFAEATPITNELLRYWFSDSFCELRSINFHEGGRQAILNTIYAHEVLKASSVLEMYTKAGKEWLEDSAFLLELAKEKYQHPKYCMKMATGTGKTWVMHALLIWQYLNAKYEETLSGKFSKNFLLVAPGLIVYERLLDAYSGKQEEDGTRNFDKSDFKQFEQLFIPPGYKDDIFGFLQSAVAKKEEIGRKVTGDGLIAITNWHLLTLGEEEEEEPTMENIPASVKQILPITPGTTAGHSLEVLDNQYLGGGEVEYLASLLDLVTFNDEAHHIHENKTYGELKEVEWQRSLTNIAQPKGTRFIQVDFSATPYDVTGSGQKRTKHYFPHIVVNFDLKEAIYKGIVKTIALDKRKEIATLDLNFRAVRENRKVIALSDGQRTMLRAGLSKLRLLEKHFTELTQNKEGVDAKYPKMFVICEDTDVTPFVVEFMVREEGLTENDVMQIDSDKKGSIPEKEWKTIKQRLFNMDKHSQPKVIVSVLMLREGFDVNNICVVVPLRSADAPILLEQTIGRGLRLMWREPEFQDSKEENRQKLLVEKTEPDNLMDILHIVEHPKFTQFYEELIKEGAAGITTGIGGGTIGDIVRVGMKPDFERYDLFWPTIVKDSEEELQEIILDVETMKPFTLFKKEQLEQFINRKGDVFFSEEMTVKTRFGEYTVTGDLLTAQSYNEFLGKLIAAINKAIVNIGGRKNKAFPFLQVNSAKLAQTLDGFIRTKLFSEPFDPFANNNWKILLVAKSGIVEHLIREMSEAIYRMQQNIKVSEAVVLKNYFSEVPELRMREQYCLNIQKTIYKVQSYPSNKGGFEKDFMLFADRQSDVEAFIKINEHYHDFAKIFYVRTDGLLAPYSPDFLVKTNQGMYIVETKAQEHLSNENVKQKQRATIDLVQRVNKLKGEDRMNLPWSYVLLGENAFYSLSERGATATEIFNYAKLRKEEIIEELF
jgi:type III restriction enzyme